MELISVIIPVYNIKEYLHRCIDSVITQTYGNLEILLIDDGSTDGSGLICDSYAEKDSRIKVLHKENGGVSSARNLGLQNAKGDYIGFVDGDDVIENEMFQRLLDNAKKYQCDISCCQMDTVDVNGRALTNYHTEQKILDVKSIVYEYFTEGFIKEMMYSQCNKIFSRQCLSGLYFRPYRYGEDILFIFEALMNSNKVYYDEYIGYHYIHRENSAMTRTFSIDRIDYINAIRQLEDICIKNYPEVSEKVQTWVYQHVLITMRLVIAHHQQKQCDVFLKQEKRYLRDNKRLLSKLSFKRRLDYFAVMYFPIYINILTKMKGKE